MGERTTTCRFAHTLHHKIPVMGSIFCHHYDDPVLDQLREIFCALLTTKK